MKKQRACFVREVESKKKKLNRMNSLNSRSVSFLPQVQEVRSKKQQNHSGKIFPAKMFKVSGS